MPLPWAWAAKKSNSSSQFCWKNPRYLYTRAQLFKGNRVKFIPGFFFFCSKAFSWIFFSIPFRVSNHQIVCTKRSKLNLLFKFSYLNSNFWVILNQLWTSRPRKHQRSGYSLQWLWFCGLHTLQLKTPHNAKKFHVGLFKIVAKRVVSLNTSEKQHTDNIPMKKNVRTAMFTASTFAIAQGDPKAGLHDPSFTVHC